MFPDRCVNAWSPRALSSAGVFYNLKRLGGTMQRQKSELEMAQIDGSHGVDHRALHLGIGCVEEQRSQMGKAVACM